MSRLTPEQVRRRLDRSLVPAVPVPFTATTEIDLDAQARYVGYMRGQPVAGVAVWAHTGRGLHLSSAQRLQVVRAWSEGLNPRPRAGGKIVVAGIGGAAAAGYDLTAFANSALEMADDALAGGAHAFLVHPPSPFRRSPDLEALVLDYHQRLARLGAPLILFYLYEAAGGIAYSPALLRRLLALPQVVGIKLATLDSVMTFQSVANLVAGEFPRKLLITGEDRFLGYSLTCGARAALIGMGAACTGLQQKLLRAHFDGKAATFLALSEAVDRLSQVTFVPPMEGYIRRMLWVLAHLGVIERESAHDPWGPELEESEFAAIGKTLRALGELPSRRGRGVAIARRASARSR